MRHRRDVVSEEPLHGSPNVLFIDPQPVDPVDLAFRGPVHLLDQGPEELGVAPFDLIPAPIGVEQLGGELPHRGQHPEPGAGSSGDHADEAVPSERVQKIERSILGQLGDHRRSRHRPPLDEHGQRGHEVPPALVEQADAPLDRRTQAALPLREIDRAGSECVEHVLQPRQQGDRIEQADPSGGQFDGERQAVEAAADLHDRGGVVVGELEVVADRLRPVDEQLHGRQQ